MSPDAEASEVVRIKFFVNFVQVEKKQVGQFRDIVPLIVLVVDVCSIRNTLRL
jgi:hypothetical protein